MTALSFDEHGVDVEYNGHEFRLDRDLIEGALQKSYGDATDHEVLGLIEADPALDGEPQQIRDLL